MPWFVSPDGQYQQVLSDAVAEFTAAHAEYRPCAPPPWRPRSSALSGYFACLYRAACDRAWHEERDGAWAPDTTQQTKMYADHGTICHYLAQQAVRAQFAETARPPTEEQYQNARELFGGSEADRANAASLAASVAISLLPHLPLGSYWLAEEAWESPTLTGHTDLRSSCSTYVIDFKFTSVPPKHHRIKPEHVPQMAAYTLLVQPPPKFIRIIYVDAQRAAWSVAVTIDCQTDAWQWYVNHVRQFTEFLCSDALWDVAVPAIGQHCGSLWCPFRAHCFDVVYPPIGTYFDALKARTPKGPFIFSASSI